MSPGGGGSIECLVDFFTFTEMKDGPLGMIVQNMFIKMH